MSEQALQFESIAVHRALGIGPSDRFELSGLGAGVNLIFGPNGSGKTTTARAARALIWPNGEALDRPWIAARLRVGESTWEVDLEAGRLRWRENGQPAEPPALGSPAGGQRYYLSLHELLRGEQSGEAFAEAVQRLMQGGLDVQAACTTLGFQPRARGRGQDRSKLEQRRRAVDEARARQHEVRQLADRRAAVQERKSKAAGAAGNLSILQTALEYHEKREACDSLQRRLDAFAPQVGRLRGDEAERLRTLAEQAEKLAEQHRRETERLAEGRKTQAATQLPEEGVGSQTLRRAQGFCQALQKAEQRVEQERARLREAEEQAEAAKARLGHSLSEAQLERLNRVEGSDLAALSRRAQRVAARREVLAMRRRWLGDEQVEDEEGDAESLRGAIALLGQWLKAGEADAAGRWSGWAGVVVIGLLSMALGVLVHVGWLALLVVAAGLAIWAWLERKQGAANRDGMLRQQYEALGYPQPVRWDAEGAAVLLDELTGRLHAAREAERKATMRQQLAHEEAELEADEQALAEQIAQARAQMGAPAGKVEDEWLSVLAESVGRWHAARDEAAGRRAALEEAEAGRAEALSGLNALLSPYGYEPACNGDEAAELVEDLRQRQERHEKAANEIRQAQAAIEDRIQPQRENVRADRDRLLGELGLNEGDEAKLHDWLAQKPEHEALVKQLSDEQAVREDRRAKLAKYPHLLEQSAEQLQRDYQEQRELADELDDLTGELEKIRTQVEQAKEAHDLTDALSAQDEATARLVAMRDTDAQRSVGALLGDHIQQAGAKQSQPQVLTSANGYFQRFTHHRLSLSVQRADDGPAFVAEDHVKGGRRGLEALSTGERVQLLLAVRMGFIEHEERVRLPLLMDEVLGVSDDARAAAVMDAVIEIAQAGRQVLYFTAQQDELARWEARLAEGGLAWRSIDLLEVRREAKANRLPVRTGAPQLPAPPSPEGLSHAEYGRRLGVAGIDPWADSAEGLHLWHLVDDLPALHRLLGYGIETWGQLKAVHEHGGEALTEAETDFYARAAAAARVVEAAAQTWRIGRGRPVDPIVLAQADCVTERFQEPLSALCRECQGHAEALLERVEQIDGWGPKRTQQLRTYLEEAGHLDTRSPLSDEELRARILAAAGAELAGGRLSSEWVNRLVEAFRSDTAAQV